MSGNNLGAQEDDGPQVFDASDFEVEGYDASAAPAFELEELPEDHRSGVVAVIGRPNVGKSTLLNRLLGQKIAITSPKPQTTRDQLLGILTLPDAQFLFMDTPGMHQPEHKLGEYMMTVVKETLTDADVVLWLVDINTPPTKEDSRIADVLRGLYGQKQLTGKVILGLNKLDQYNGGDEQLEERIAHYRQLVHWLGETSKSLTAIPFSALSGEGGPALQNAVREALPLGPRYYPADQVTDIQTRFIVAELIREKALMHLQQEVPHSLAVVVDEFTPRSEDMTYISAILYVERKSQKGIVLGQHGSMIKKIGKSARPEIENLVGTRVYLELWVKVYEKWRRREPLLRRLGYATS